MGRPANKPRNAELVRLRISGWTYRQLAQRFNISIARAHQLFMHAKTESLKNPGLAFAQSLRRAFKDE